MKLKHYRDPELGACLKKAAEEWRAVSPERCFEKPEGFRFSSYVVRICFWLLYLLVPVVMVTTEEEPLMLALILPALAVGTFDKFWTFKNLIEGCSASPQLPLSNKRMDHEIRRRWKKPILKGACLSIFWGLFLRGEMPSFAGSLNSLAVYCSLLGLLSICLLPFCRSLFQMAAYGAYGSIFIFFVFEPWRPLLQKGFEILPWYQALAPSPNTFFWLAGLILAGVTGLWITRSIWSSVAPHDRTNFYEVFGGGIHDQEAWAESNSDQTSQLISNVKPRGLIEQMIWNTLGSKERILMSMSLFEKKPYLGLCLCGGMIGIIVAWVMGHSGWIDSGKQYFLVPFALVFLVISLNHNSLAVLNFLGAMQVSSQTLSSKFNALPFTLPTLEKMAWKEGAPKWILAASIFSLIAATYTWQSKSLAIGFISWFCGILALVLPLLVFGNLCLGGKEASNIVARIFFSLHKLYWRLVFPFISLPFSLMASRAAPYFLKPL